MATNDITGDEIRSKASSDKFRDGWDAIFGKKSKDFTIIPEDELSGMSEEDVEDCCLKVKEAASNE